MFRFLDHKLPEDPVFPADLDKLGYMITEKDQIRSREDPEQDFHYFISKNERYKDANREAFNTCIRNNILERVQAPPLSLKITNLPTGTPSSDPHIPILTSSNITSAKRVIIYIGESTQDLGIFAYRTIGQESIAKGSIITFADDLLSLPDKPGFICANPGQLIWWHRGHKAVTSTTWYSLPRKSEVHPYIPIDTEKNRVRKNEDVRQHVQSIFEDAVTTLTDKDVKIQVIAMGDGATEVFDYLHANWAMWENRVDSVIVGVSYVWYTEFTDQHFKEFWGKYARVYCRSDEPLDTPLGGRKHFGCNVYSAGEDVWMECVMVKAYPSMLRYLDMRANRPEYFAEPQAEEEDEPAGAEDEAVEEVPRPELGDIDSD